MSKKASAKLIKSSLSLSDENIKTLNRLIKDKDVDVYSVSGATRFCIEAMEEQRKANRKAARAAKGKK